MSFLKKLGTILASAVKVVTPFGSILDAILPQKAASVSDTVIHDLPAIAAIVTQVEGLGAVLTATATAGTPGLTGAQKLQAAAPMVAQILLASDMLKGHKIADPALFQKAATEFAQATVDLLNSLDAGSIKTTDMPT